MTVPTAGQGEPAGLMTAFWEYERALMANDLSELDRLFADSDDTLRGDAAGLLVGHQQISAFRGSRGGAPARTICEVHVRPIDDDSALVVAVTELARGGRGQQTQLWRRHSDAGWQVAVAHVSAPAEALDVRIWRAVGAPLVAGSGHGPLTGETVAVKDLFDVAGIPVGAGNAAYLAAARPAVSTARALSALLAAGADVRGLARLDEFAYSLAGVNQHYGMPPNPAAPYRAPGGSTSGSATAVSLGQASIGLGTDTAGSIRIPAAYQGLYAIRTTHGAVSRDGLLPLAPSFDTVGWLTRGPELLARVGDVLLPTVPVSPARVVVEVPDLMALADSDVAAAVAASLPKARTTETWDLSDLDAWVAAFRTVQGFEAWQFHGSWLAARLDTLGPGVRERFEVASTITAGEVAQSSRVLDDARVRIREFVDDRAVALPAAGSVAPFVADVAAARETNLRLTCLASIAGLPAVTIPLRTADGLPTAVCLIAAAGRDRDLLALAAGWSSTPAVA